MLIKYFDECLNGSINMLIKLYSNTELLFGYTPFLRTILNEDSKNQISTKLLMSPTTACLPTKT